MRHLQLTLDTPAENLALDEALLEAAEAGELDGGVLRLWESPRYFTVLGRSSSADVEVNLSACQLDEVPVLRRCSGGGTIVAGPGCLMYALVLSLADHPYLQAIAQAHDYVLDKIAQQLTTERVTAIHAGVSDLAIRSSEATHWQKFSGNAMRLKRKYLLYHGTLLYDFDLRRAERWLATPTRTPDYRGERRHEEFITNLDVGRESLIQKLVGGWHAHETLLSWPTQRVTGIVETKYTADPKWMIHTPAE